MSTPAIFDRTLVDFEIEAYHQQDSEFIRGFDSACLKGASYDVRVGDELYVTTASQGTFAKFPDEFLNQGTSVKGFVIEPAQTVVIKTMECLHLPLDMMGRISLRSLWATRGLSYPGGIIDPGYWGHLFIAIFNIENSPLEIKVGESIATIQFVRLSSAARNIFPVQIPITSLPADRRPRTPKVDLYSSVALKNLFEKEIQRINEAHQEIKEEFHGELALDRMRAESVQRIVEFGFFALVAAVGASVGIGALQFAAKIGGELGLGIGVAFVLFLFIWTFFTALSGSKNINRLKKKS